MSVKPRGRKATLRLAARAGRVVSIQRSFEPGTAAPGIVTEVGEEWALVAVVSDLALDGWECVRVRDVVGVTRGSHERFAEKVLAPRRRAALAPRLDSTAALLESLRMLPMLSVENEAAGDFLLGRVLELDDRSLLFHGVDPGGRWDRSATRKALRDVTRVAFGDHYGAMYAKHAPYRAPRRRHTHAR